MSYLICSYSALTAFLFAAIFLHFNLYTYNFSENDGTINDAIKVQKELGSPPTEVDIPLRVFTFNGSATNGSGKPFTHALHTIYKVYYYMNTAVLALPLFKDGDFVVTNSVQPIVIQIDQHTVNLGPITINDDDFPEGTETFILSLTKGDDADNLNIFPYTSNATVVIADNDGKAKYLIIYFDTMSPTQFAKVHMTYVQTC